MKLSMLCVCVVALSLGCKSGGEVKEERASGGQAQCDVAGKLDPIAVALAWAAGGMVSEGVELGAKAQPWLVANRGKGSVRTVRAASLGQDKWQVLLAQAEEPATSEEVLGVTLRREGVCSMKVERLDLVPSTLFWPEL